MRDGVWLGLLGILTLYVWRMSIVNHIGDFLFIILIFCGPIISFFLTRRYRLETVGNNDFTFVRGFTHSLFTGFYASVWVALVLFLYLQYFDHGTVFVAYANLVYSSDGIKAVEQLSPEWRMAIETMSNGRGAEGLANTFQDIGAATYATLPIYLAFIIGPIISIFIGLLCQRKNNYI